jgi:hypothetical protein
MAAIAKVAKSFAKDVIKPAIKAVSSCIFTKSMASGSFCGLVFQYDAFKAISSGIDTAPNGSRAWPKKNMDEKLGVRFDWGEKFQDPNSKKWYRNLVLQLNKGAENPSIKAIAAKDSHAKRAVIPVQMNEDGTRISEEFKESELVSVFDDGV